MTVETQANVADLAKPSDAELDMIDYAAKRNRGERIVLEPAKKAEAAATETNETAAAAATEEESEAAAAVEVEEGSTTTEESATADDQQGEVEEKPKAKKGIDKRFSELTKAKKEAEARAEQAQKELDQKTAEINRLQAIAAEAARSAVPVVKSSEDDPVPNRNDFDDPDQYTSALSAHASRSEIRKANEEAQKLATQRAKEAQTAVDKARQEQINASINKLHADFQERQAKVMEKLPDYKEKVLENDKLVLQPAVFFTIEKAEMGPQVLYHLADHPEEAENLNKLYLANPVDATIRLGELQAEIRAANKPQVSKAKPPVKAIGHRSSPERTKPEDMPMGDYFAMRAEQDRQAFEKAHPVRRDLRKT